MTALQEYNLEIKPAKIVKGKGMCLLTHQLNDPENQQVEWEQEETIPTGSVNAIETTTSEWYDHIKFFLNHGFSPETLDSKKRTVLRLKSAPYQFIDGILFRKNYHGVFLRCLEKDQTHYILFQFHAGSVGGHFSGETIAHKIIGEGYYWPTLFRYAHAYMRKCEPFQKCARKVKKPSLPLQPVVVQFPFQQWGLDLVGPINLVSSLQHKYILIATYYFTRWVEAIPLRQCNTDQVISFLES